MVSEQLSDVVKAGLVFGVVVRTGSHDGACLVEMMDSGFLLMFRMVEGGETNKRPKVDARLCNGA